MKVLDDFALKHNLRVVKITYRFQGMQCSRKGYDLVTQDNSIFISFEPDYYLYSKIKWFIRNSHEGFTGNCHIERITKEYLEKHINPMAKSFNKLKQNGKTKKL